MTKNNNIIAYICFISENYLLKTKNFKLTLEKSFDPRNTEPTQNWFVTIEGKLDKIEKQLADNIIYDWAKQPKKPTYTPEEIGAEKAGAADGILNNAIKYTDGEISRLEDIVIPTKITELNDKKAEKVHSHLVSDITDFPTSLPEVMFTNGQKQEQSHLIHTMKSVLYQRMLIFHLLYQK